MSLKDRLTNTSNPSALLFKGIVYGPPGAGKTTLAKDMPKLGKTLIVSAESGTLPLAGCDLDMLTVTSYAEVGQLLQDIHNGEADEFDVLYVDSLTEIGKLYEQAMFGRFAEWDEEKGMYAVPKRNSFGYYGALARELEQFVRFIRDLRKHVFFSALPKSWQNDDTGESGHKVSFGSQAMSDMLPGLFDFVWAYRTIPHEETGEAVRVLHTQTSVDKWYAKTRQPIHQAPMPLMIPNPDLGAIALSIINNNGGAS